MKDLNILISIIVPVFNVEDYIERCLYSLINQTLKEIEIIVVNDGSTDKTLEILEKYSENDSRIKIFSQSNCGVSLARKKGVKESQGEYICFVDGDDWCEMNMCEDLYNTAKKTKSDMIFFSAYRHREDGTAIIRNFPVDDGKYEIKDIYDDYILPLYGDLHTDKYVTTGYACFCMFKSNIIKKMKFYKNINLHEDEIAILQGLNSANYLYIISNPYYHYDRTDRNTLSKGTRYWGGYWDNMIEVFYAKQEIANNLFESKEEYMYRLITYMYIHFLRTIRNETHYLNPKRLIGGYKNLCSNLDKKILFENKQYMLKGEFTYIERLLIKLIQMHIYFVPYLYYSIKCGRMKNFREKTKN